MPPPTMGRYLGTSLESGGGFDEEGANFGLHPIPPKSLFLIIIINYLFKVGTYINGYRIKS